MMASAQLSRPICITLPDNLPPDDSSCESTTWYLTEELQRPFGSKDFAVLEIAVFCPDVRLKHIDGLTETMFKTTTDGILLLIFVRWNS
jgi:hypothetical protein